MATKVARAVKFSSEPNWISTKQLDMAMACLDLETEALAQATGLDLQRVEKLVAGEPDPLTLKSLRDFFEKAGLVFIIDENGNLGLLFEP